MKRNSQLLPLFLIIAIFLLLSFSLLYYLIYQKNSGDGTFRLGQDIELTSQTNLVRSLVQNCLEEKTQVAINQLCGAGPDSEVCIEQYLRYYLSDCFNPAELANRGIDIEAGTPLPSVIVNYDSVLVDLSYPLKIRKNNQLSELRSFSYDLPLNSLTRLNLDSNQQTTQEIRVLSRDGAAELIIPQGTRIYSSSQEPITSISLRVADRHEGGLVNSVVTGMTVYDAQPEGIRFSPAITIRIKYNPLQLRGLPEDQLKLGWYDTSLGIWKGLPTSSVDLANKIVSANISHFTKIGAVACTSPNSETDTIKFSYKNIITGKKAEDVMPQQPVAQPPAQPAEPVAITPLSDPASQTFPDTYSDSTLPPLIAAAVANGQTNPLPDTSTPSSASAPQPDPANPSDYIIPTQDCTCSCEKNCKAANTAEIAASKLKDYVQFNFTLPPGGTACIMEQADEEADLRVDLLCSAGDRCAGTDFTDKDGYKDLTTKVLFNPDPDAALLVDNGLKSGENFIYIKLENTNNDNCAWADAKVYIRGRNIAYPAQCDLPPVLSDTPAAVLGLPTTSSGECTVQDAINTLCGQGDPAYNDNYPNCEKDKEGRPVGFMDSSRSPGLAMVMDTAQALDPTNWRNMLLSRHPSGAQVVSNINALGLRLRCGSFASSGLACYAPSTASSTENLGQGGTSDADPDAGSTSTRCTAWEMSMSQPASQEALKALIRVRAREAASRNGIADTSSLDIIEKMLVGMAYQETALSHCCTPAVSWLGCTIGDVITGDGGSSIGLLAVPKTLCANGQSSLRLDCNIEQSVKHLIQKYSDWKCDAGHTNDCTNTCNQFGLSNCAAETQFFQGWDCALRGYNGFGCRFISSKGTLVIDGQTWKYCGPDCNDYVKKVKTYAGLPPTDTSSSSASPSSTSTSSSSTSPASLLGAGSVQCTPVLAGDVPVNECQAAGDFTVGSIEQCSQAGGWPTTQTSAGAICCKTSGCCVTSTGLLDSSRVDCLGTTASSAATPSAPTDSGSCGDQIVSIAQSALDRPYTLGAAEWDPASIPAASAAIDCSSFTKWVFNRYATQNSNPAFHIDSRLAGTQAQYNGRVVDHDPTKDHNIYASIFPDCSKLQKGDLIFFYYTSGKPEVSHVGIYIGDCKMIHAGAPEPTDPTFDDWSNLNTHKVQVVSLTSNYRKEYYIGAKRLCPDAAPAASTLTGAASSTPQPAQTAARKFLESSCSEVKGCCSWEGNSKCAKSVSKSACAGKSGSVFTVFDEQCAKYPSCAVSKIQVSNSLIAYAQQYLGCPYSGPATGLWTPAQCSNGLTCATYVSSVYNNICGINFYKDGGNMCYSDYVTMLGSSPSELQPGDIFSFGVVDSSNGKYGHTGMYVGKGSIDSSKMQYTPDDNGDYIFIHSTSVSPQKVSYTTYEWLLSYAPVRFCRVNSCPNNKAVI